MALSSIGATTNPAVQSLIDMRTQFNELARQLSSGQKSATYAGLGIGGGLSVNLNSQLSAITGYDNTIDMASTRINLAQDALGQVSNIGSTLRSALANGNATAGNVNIAQSAAQSSLQQLVSLLNTQAGNRYLFSGLATDQTSVESYDHILNGDGARAGLTQLIDERTQADYGTSGLGRLVISRADRDLGASGGGRRLALRLQARLGLVDLEQRDRERAERLATEPVGQLHRPAQ